MKKPVQTNLSDSVAAAVRQVAENEGISEAAVIRRAVMRDPDVQQALPRGNSTDGK